MPPSLQLTFLGANATVTGSRQLVDTPSGRLLVDCGLFQGYKPPRLRNWAEFPVDPATIDAVVLTHAHLDHSGYLPRLVREGFRGPVWCTPATRAVCGILLPDSGRLLEEEASHANRRGTSRHQPAPTGAAAVSRSGCAARAASVPRARGRCLVRTAARPANPLPPPGPHPRRRG